MSPTLELLPNVGAEEGADWREHLAHPQVRTVIALWRLLFGPALRLPAAPEFEDWWPESLGDRPDSTALEGLPEDAGVQPWLVTPELSKRTETLHGADPAVVAKVHDKAFAQRFAEREGYGRRDLLGAVQVLDPELFDDPGAACARIREAVADWPAWMRAHYTLKPRFGTSGRGRVGIRNEDGPEAHAGAFERLRDRGGAILEPWLERIDDLSTQLRIAEDGTVQVVAGLRLISSPAGLYVGHRGAVDNRGRLYAEHAFEEEARGAAAALAGEAAAAGFRGFCGVDAFTYLAPEEEGARGRLRPLVELNARYTTGTVVAGLVRRALRRVRGPLELGASDRRGFAFALAPPAPCGTWEEARERCGEGALLIPLGPVPGLPDARPALLFCADPGALDEAFAPPGRPARGR